MTKTVLLRLFAIVGTALGLLAQTPQAQAATQQFQLHYRCSPWLYLSAVTENMRDTWTRSRGTVVDMDIAATNAQLCRQNAEKMTYAVNTVFSMSGIPANFTFTTEVVPGGGAKVIGLRFRPVLFTHNLHEEVEGLINGGTPVPDVYVDDLDWVLDVDTSTCNPFATAGECASTIGDVCPASTSIYSLCKNAAGGTVFYRASPFPRDYHSLTMFDTDTWSAATAVKAARKINITLRATPGPGTQILGITNGSYDRASTVLSLNNGTLTRRALTPANYLPTVGVITLIAGPNSLFNVTAAPHEVGHVFGAQHQRSALVGGEFYNLAGLANSYQFANLASEMPPEWWGTYDTIMVSHVTVNGKLNFSTPIGFWTYKFTPPPCSLPDGGILICPVGLGCSCRAKVPLNIGSTNTDNRRYVGETIKWITGDASFTLSAPSDPANNSLYKAMP